MSSLTEAVTALQTKVTNLKTAIYNKTDATPDDLSDCVTAVGNMNKVYYLGTGTSFNIKTLFPNQYSSLSTSNFIVEVNTLSTSGSSTGGAYGVMYSSSGGGSEIFASTSSSNTVTVSKSYNTSTGVLTISNLSTSSSNSSTNTSGAVTATDNVNTGSSVTIKVYCVIGSIATKS